MCAAAFESSGRFGAMRPQRGRIAWRRAGVAAALRQAPSAPPATDPSARLNALFDAFMDERFVENPELVTVLGLDKDKYAWAKSKLTDASLGHVREVKRNNAA